MLGSSTLIVLVIVREGDPGENHLFTFYSPRSIRTHTGHIAEAIVEADGPLLIHPNL